MHMPDNLLPILYGALGGLGLAIIGTIAGFTLLTYFQRAWVVRLLWISMAVALASIAALILVLTTRGGA
jgi:hypothetical protein